VEWLKVKVLSPNSSTAKQKNKTKSWIWWPAPVISAATGSENRRIEIPGWPEVYM
jgi:hypothetical protein